jgi:hypothetical protein
LVSDQISTAQDKGLRHALIPVRVIEFGRREDARVTNQPPPSPPTKEQIELQKRLHEQSAEAAQPAHDRSNAFARQINEAAINAANLTLRMALLINGAAAVALLTFVGSLPAEQKRAVAATLDWFAWGVAAAVAGLACAYFTNHGLAVQERSKTFIDQPPYVIDGADTKRWRYFVLVFRLLAIIVGSGSVILFLVGMLGVRAALTKLA